MPSLSWSQSPCKTILFLALACALFFALTTSTTAVVDDSSAPTEIEESLLKLSIPEIDEKLQSCEFVQELNRQRHDDLPETSSLMKRVFVILFPGSPAVNSLLATAYISGPPNFLLALCPADIDPSSLSVMVAFAVGGLLGDTLLHLVPQTFMGEPHDNRAHFIMNDGRRNAVLGLFIFIGFAVFVAMDKTLRILTGGTGGDGHSHSHSHSVDVKAVGSQSGADTSKNSGGLKHRKTDVQSSITSNSTAPNSSVASQQNVKPSAILNLISDFTHNITDGLAMSGAFYTSPIMGATTCMAVMLHEIPHEIGDFALLIQGGFTKWQAMGAQFITALGAFTGTIIGICIQEYSRSGSNSVGGKSAVSMGAGILGSDLSAGDLVLPFTAGTFLYVGFSVIPELLENTPGMTKSAEAKKTLIQAVAMAIGFAAMFLISE